ncbi:hypothetical protein [Amycolatopsis anabasis]|uniref:hypothetical protein n=1 Tax=Amycolatopsis anabasis TaxID=1840409 RepID=UPI00131DD6C9|nr:hypothetical protein [Amycolatopsis anabasis]
MDDNGGFADNGSNAAAASPEGSGVGDGLAHLDIEDQAVQVANGAGASNQNNTASVNDDGYSEITQSNTNTSTTINFSELW